MDINEKIKKWHRGLKNSVSPDEYEVKNLLREFDISVPGGKRFAAFEQIDMSGLNAPYVVKVCSSDIMHKTDLGGVMLNIDREALQLSINEMRNRFPGQSLLIEEQIKPESIEFIIGALVDPNLGPAVMVGVGGILTELYKDVSFRLIPCSRNEVNRMIGELKVYPVFDGFRGLNLNREGFVEIVTAVSALVTALGERFDQLDLNPVVFSKNRWVALDARLIMSGMSMW